MIYSAKIESETPNFWFESMNGRIFWAKELGEAVGGEPEECKVTERHSECPGK